MKKEYWNKIEEKLAIFLWGQEIETDTHKLAKTITPFLKNIIVLSKQEATKETLKKIEKELLNNSTIGANTINVFSTIRNKILTNKNL